MNCREHDNGAMAHCPSCLAEYWKMTAAGYKQDACEDLNAVEKQLAASQAQIKVLRDALNAMLTHMGMDEDEWSKPTFDQARKALAQPTDDTALRELLKAERERCAKVVERLISGDGICADDGVWIHDCAEAIRAMEDQ